MIILFKNIFTQPNIGSQFLWFGFNGLGIDSVLYLSLSHSLYLNDEFCCNQLMIFPQQKYHHAKQKKRNLLIFLPEQTNE